MIGFARQILAQTGGFVTPGRQDVIARAATAVDSDSPGLDPAHPAQRAGKIARVDPGAKAIDGMVSQRRCRVPIGEALEGQNRDKDFLKHGGRLVGHAVKDGGGIEEPRRIQRRATAQNPGLLRGAAAA